MGQTTDVRSVRQRIQQLLDERAWPDCPYYDRMAGQSGADPNGRCGQHCRMEPVCVDEPEGGYLDKELTGLLGDVLAVLDAQPLREIPQRMCPFVSDGEISTWCLQEAGHDGPHDFEKPVNDVPDRSNTPDHPHGPASNGSTPLLFLHP